MKKIERLVEEYEGENLIKMDGYDECIVGVVRRCASPTVLCYSYKKVIKQLMKEGMTEEDAIEHFEFNQIGAWVGEGTPFFLFD
jgi:hypothetical protein